MAVSPEWIYLDGAAGCAAVAAYTDLRSRRVPNWLTGPAMAAGLVLHAALGGVRGLGSSVLAGLLAGGIFLVFFIAGGMGAGDVKLMAAVGALAGLGPMRGVLILTALLGAMAAVIVAVASGRLRETIGNSRAVLAHHQANGLQAHPEFHVGNASMLRLPYALPIAAACLLTLMMHACGGFSL